MKKTIIITGGSDGLGKSLAHALSKENNVIILSTNENKLEKTSKELNCSYKVCDVRSYNQLEKRITEILNEHKRIDVLINNAGIWIQNELDENDPERIKQTIEVNLIGTINASKSVIPAMKQQKDGLIININSQAGINHKAERTVYNASKWGITGFTKSLQDELSKYEIRVTNLMPGKMKTDMFNKMNIIKKMDDGLETKEVARLVKFLIDTPKDVMIPEIGIKHINN